MNQRILVVDDEEVIRFTFRTFLENERYEVVATDNYVSAVEEIESNDFDLIFADIILKGDSGIDILRKVKDMGLRCPVIMITGQPDIDNASESVRLGAFDYLPKPVKKDAILHAARLALAHKRLLDEKEVSDIEKERYRRNLEAIFQSVKDGIVTVTPNLKIIENNSAFKLICGVDQDDIIGNNYCDLSNGCSQSCVPVLKETLKSEKIIKEFRIECGHPDRSRQVAVLSCSPLKDQHGKFRGAVLVIRDITRLTNLEDQLRERYQFHHIIGKSSRMKAIYPLLENLANTDTTVLITGESGTGKEVAANALHYTGTRADQPLVKVNCSALAENLLESELFGHVKGAFTGALKDMKGRFQAADGGTILLDEIGDISPRIQLKLLRVLQEKVIERVGDSRPIKVDVRVLASTNCDLKKKVQSGEFREDLYYRLKVVEVKIPPLRERKEDIPLLVRHFCHKFNSTYQKHIDGVTEAVMKRFMHHAWPGNVRELEHAIEHAFVLCPGRKISIDHLPEELMSDLSVSPFIVEDPIQGENQSILDVLNRTDWNKAKAARILGISRQTLYRKIEELHINQPA